MKKLLKIAALTITAISAFAQTNTVTFDWDPTQGTQHVLGYRLYRGTAHGVYTNQMVESELATATMTWVGSGTNYLIVKAYNRETNSPPSNELVFVVDPPAVVVSPLSSPENLRPHATDIPTPPVTVPVPPVVNQTVTNRAPVVTSVALEATAGVPLPFTLQAVDPDGDALSYFLTFVPVPNRATVSGNPPNMSITFAQGVTGTDRVNFRVSDPSGATANGMVVFQIK